MEKQRIGVDIDNVIANTDSKIRQIIEVVTNGRVRLEYKDIKDFDYYKCVDRDGEVLSKEEWNKVHEVFSEPENISSLSLAPNSKEQLKILAERFEIILCTSRMLQAELATKKWLSDNDIPYGELIFCTHRKKHEPNRSFHAFIEDDYDQAMAFADAGTHAILIKHPWNISRPPHNSISWVSNWMEVAKLLQ